MSEHEVWECPTCRMRNYPEQERCVVCGTNQPGNATYITVETGDDIHDTSIRYRALGSGRRWYAPILAGLIIGSIISLGLLIAGSILVTSSQPERGQTFLYAGAFVAAILMGSILRMIWRPS